MDVEKKELIALGASLSAHCVSCFDSHLRAARRLGISEEDIQEAVRIGFVVMNGSEDKMREEIKEILKEFSPEKGKGGSGCCAENKGFSTFPMIRF